MAAFLALACGARASDTTAATPDADEVINFSLLDFTGRYYELRRADTRVVVLFFTENGCPVARQSIEKLKALRKRYADQDVAIWMVDANFQDDRASIEKEAEDFKVGTLPVLIDDTQEVAKMLHVKRSAETLCIDTSNSVVFYRGALDDQLVEGARKPAPTQQYVRDALDQFLAGKPVAVSRSLGRGCLLTFEDEGDAGKQPISYVKQISPLLEQRCANCHRPGDIAPFAMNSYKKVKGHADMIREAVLDRRMPPWDADPRWGHFKNDRSLTLAQKKLLLRWVDQGAPRDDGPDPLARETPAPPEWPLGQPDYIVKLPTPQEIPATGVLDYRYVDVPSPIANDVWLSAAVFRPDNKRVVHHLIVRAKYDKTPKQARDDVFLTGWAPGYDNPAFPEGTGKFLGKGATLNFELHYTVDGKPETDQSELGLYVLKERPKLPLDTVAAYNLHLVVAPNEPEAPCYAVTGFKQDTMIFDLAPHMHLRGSWFKYEALYPNGDRETLLSVPRYDFNWQTIYRLAEPKVVPAGTWILCTGGFDNSNHNPNNPNPDKRIKWGDQSFDEMFIGFLNVATLPSTNHVNHTSGAAVSTSTSPLLNPEGRLVGP